LKLKPSKCALSQPEVKYLGHVVGSDGVATVPKNIQAVKDWVTHWNLSELLALLGLVGYYRHYIPDIAQKSKPLSRLTAKRVYWRWNHAEQQASDHLKGCLGEAPNLAYLILLKNTSCILHNVGAVLSQVQDSR